MAVRILPARTIDLRTPERPVVRLLADRRALVVAVAFPVLLFVAMRLVFAVVTPTGLDDWGPETWARWDSGHYRSIADEGYYVQPCVERGEVDVTPMCSNAAWYPAYPVLAKVGTGLGLSWDVSAILISQLASVGILLFLWNGFLGARWTTRNVAIMVLAAFFPGSVYFLAAFPMSLLVLLMLGQIWLFRQRRWYAGAVVGMVASLVYPISLVLGPACALWCYLADDGPRAARFKKAGWVGGIISMGTLTVFAAHQLVIGRWDMSLEQQRWFGASINNPASQLWTIIVERASYMQVTGAGLADLMAAQTLLVLLLMISVVGVTLWRAFTRTRLDLGAADDGAPGDATSFDGGGAMAYELVGSGAATTTVATVPAGSGTEVEREPRTGFARLAAAEDWVRRTFDRDDLGLLLLVAAMWALPLVNTVQTGLYRREAALLPLVLLLRKAPTWLVVGFALAVLPVWAMMANKFYWFVLI